MPRPRLDPEQAKLKRQLRNKRYEANVAAKQRKLEYDRVYQQRRRQQLQLNQHEDPLIRLTDITTQQEYLEAANNEGDISQRIDIMLQEAEAIDMAGTIYEDGEVLDNFGDDGLIDGYIEGDDNDWNHDLDDGFNIEMNMEGIQLMLSD